METIEFLQYVAAALEATGVAYMVVGSVASAFYGEPRFTNDVDVVVAIEADDLPLLQPWFADERYYFDLDSIRACLAQRTMFNVLDTHTGLKADLIPIASTVYAQTQLARRVEQDYHGSRVSFARPEDVILNKLLWYGQGGSERQLRDVAGVVLVSGAELDRDYLASWAARLGVAEVWAALLARLPEQEEGTQ